MLFFVLRANSCPVDLKRFVDIEIGCEHTGTSLRFQFEAIAGGSVWVETFENEISSLVTRALE